MPLIKFEDLQSHFAYMHLCICIYQYIEILWKKQTIILINENCKNDYAKDKAGNQKVQEFDLFVILLNFASFTRPKQWRVSVFAKFGEIIYTSWFGANSPWFLNFKTWQKCNYKILLIWIQYFAPLWSAK